MGRETVLHADVSVAARKMQTGSFLLRGAERGRKSSAVEDFGKASARGQRALDTPAVEAVEVDGMRVEVAGNFPARLSVYGMAG